MEPEIIFFILLGAPVTGSLISLLPKQGVEIIASLSAAVVTVVTSLVLLVLGISGTFGYFYADSLTRIMAITVSSIFLTSTSYSVFYIRKIKEPFIRFRWYYCLVNLFAFTMLLAITVNDLGFVWLAVEATTITSALLVALERKKTSVEAAWRYTLIVSAGLVISLLSVIFVSTSQGTLEFSTLLHQPINNFMIMSMAVGFALVGYGTKAGIVPMHTWLPDAHSEAPSPVSALFSAVLLPTSLYAFMRTFVLLQGSQTFADLQNLVIGFGVLTALIAAIIMGYQRNYKRMLAYSSMENMGIILVGFALGGIGTLGAIVQIVSHAFAKSAAFYSSGNIAVAYDSTKMQDAQGVINKLKTTSYLFTLSCFSVTGAPPFGVFLGEFMILTQAIIAQNFILAAILAIVYMYAFIGLNRQTISMIFGQQSKEDETNASANSSLSISKDVRLTPTNKENFISVLIPFVNLTISLIIGIYMLPVFLDAVTGMK